MKKNLFIVFAFLLISTIVTAQKSEKLNAGNSNKSYFFHDDQLIKSNFVLLPLETGELIVACTEGFRLKLLKFDNELNVINSKEIQMVESAGIKGTIIETSGFAKLLGENIFVKIKYSPLGKKNQFEIFQIFDLNLKSISDWTELGETTKYSSYQYNPGYSEERKRLDKLGRLHYNDSRIISVSLDDDNVNNHKIRAFDSNGSLAYDTSILFDNSNEDLFISSIELLDDGSLIYIYQHLGEGIYFKLLDKTGNLLEGKFPLPEKFILLENLSNPSDLDQFVLFGLDKEAKPHLFLYSFSGLGTEEIFEFDLPVLEDQYVSSWELNLNAEQELYFSGISWKGNFNSGYENKTNCHFYSINFDLKNLEKKGQSWSTILTDRCFKRDVSEKMERYEVDLNIQSKIQFLYQDDDEMYYRLINYKISGPSKPYESFLYERSAYRVLRINIKEESAQLYGPELIGFTNQENEDELVKYKLSYHKKGDYKYSLDKFRLENNKVEKDKQVDLTHKIDKKSRKNVITIIDSEGTTVSYLYCYRAGKNNVDISRFEF